MDVTARGSGRTAGKYSVEEYLAMEDAADERHEYRDGEIIAMANARTNHIRIVRGMVLSRVKSPPRP